MGPSAPRLVSPLTIPVASLVDIIRSKGGGRGRDRQTLPRLRRLRDRPEREAE
jgi:hypothetical protein